MKSTEEILNNYYIQGADGMPEISAEGLLKAMEEYRLQAEEAAFNAGRKLNADVAYIDYTFAAFDDYRKSLEVEHVPPTEPGEAEQIQFMADSILELFIPQDKSIKEISFDIRSNGKAYTVNYTKNDQDYWIFLDYTDAD